MLIRHYLLPLIKRHKLLFIGMVLMSALTFGLFVGSSYALDNYKQSIESFFRDDNYPSAVISTDFTFSSSFDCLESIEGVKNYDVRFSSPFNFKIEDNYYNVLLNTYKDDDFSKFSYISESIETENPGILVDQQFSDKHNLKIGDSVSIGKNGKFATCTVKQIILKPENLNYFVLGDIPTDNINYGVVYLNHNDLNPILNSLGIHNFGIDSNQVLLDIDSSFNEEEVLEKCNNEISKKVNILSSLLGKDTPSMILRNELTGQFVALSETVPFILLGIVSVLFILFLIQIIKRQNREIGIMLASGFQKTTIYGLFSIYTLIVSLVSIIVGSGLSVLLANITYGLYKNNVYLPFWTEQIFFGKLLLSAVIIIAAGQLACLISGLSFIKCSPRDALEPPYEKTRKLGKKVEVALNKAPSTIRLAVSSIVQNLRNFFVIVIGFTASFVMIYSAFSVYYSLQKYVSYTYEYQNNYDAQVICLSNNYELVFDKLKQNENVTKMQTYDCVTLELSFGDKKETTQIIGFPKDGDMLKFADAYSGENLQIPSEGILLDQITAEKFNIKKGDQVDVCNQKFEVISITAMYSQQFQVISIEQMQKLDVTKSKRALVNINNKDEFKKLCADLGEELYPIFTSDFQKMELDFKNSLTILINIIIIIVIILGFIVVCTVSKMTLEKQKRVISILRCQGMHIIEISNYWALQMVSQLVLSFLIGIPLSILGGSSFVRLLCSDISFYPYIRDFPIFLLSFAFIIAFSIASHLVIVYSISKFKLAENVQSRE